MKEEIWNELYLYLIRIEIGVFKNFKECARSTCNGNHFSLTRLLHYPARLRARVKKEIGVPRGWCVRGGSLLMIQSSIMKFS